MRLRIYIGKKAHDGIDGFSFRKEAKKNNEADMLTWSSASSHCLKTNSYGFKEKKKKSSVEAPIRLSGNNVTLWAFRVLGRFFVFFRIALIITWHEKKRKEKNFTAKLV